jgi:hypothetical protein
MTLFAPGRRWFAAGSIATIVVAALHTIGNTLAPEPTDAAYVALVAAMRGYVIPLGLGMFPSMWAIYHSLVFTMSICLVAMGGLGLVIGSSSDASPRLIARAALVLFVASAALTALFLFCRITPALVSMAVVTVLYGMAAGPRRASVE